MNNDCPLASSFEYLEMGIYQSTLLGLKEIMYTTQIISKRSEFSFRKIIMRPLKIGTWGMDIEWRRLICMYVKV